MISVQRNGIDVVVLEARDRVGGRVHTHVGGGFRAALDLGASIITGTETDVERVSLGSVHILSLSLSCTH